ncbi:MAG: rhodanese-like domain-containing protein [Verrucomicrobiota bacterium]
MTRPWRRLLLADIAWFGAATVVAVAAGSAGDQLFRHPPLGWRYQSAAERVLNSPRQDSRKPPVNVVTLEEVISLISRPEEVLVLDARPRIFYDLGHLPGARNLSREQFEIDLASLETILRVPGRNLLIYCSDISCEDGAHVAAALQERGMGPLLLFPGGFAEWEAAARPVETTE